MWSNQVKIVLFLLVFNVACSRSQDHINQNNKSSVSQEDQQVREEQQDLLEHSETTDSNNEYSGSEIDSDTRRRARIYDPYEAQQNDGAELQSTVIGNGKFPEEINAGFIMDEFKPKTFCVLSPDPVVVKHTAETLLKSMATWSQYLNNPNRNLPFKLPDTWLALTFLEHCKDDTDLVIIIGEAKSALDSEIVVATKKIGKELIALSGTMYPTKPGSNPLSFIYFNPKHLNGYESQSEWLQVVMQRELGLLFGLKDKEGTIMEDLWQILIDPKIWQSLDARPFMSIDRENQLIPCPACLENEYEE